MDATRDEFAYRCLPMIIANQHGWQIHNEVGFEAEWNGGPGEHDVQVWPDHPHHMAPKGHFGSGTLTWHVGGVFETPPGVDLYVTGPVNDPRDGIAPLQGVVETNWLTFTFTMNWKFVRPHYRARFEAGSPFCTVFPIPRGYVEGFEPVMRVMEGDRLAEHDRWCRSRSDFSAGKGAGDRRSWQGHYFRGTDLDGKKRTEGHRTKLRVKPFAQET